MSRAANSAPGPTVGSRLGSFRVEARIGEGGLGIVYRAYDDKLKRHVALKVLADSSSSAAAHLLEEARAAASLTHPSIAAIYDVQQQQGCVFIVMELVAGETLRAEIQRGAMRMEAVVRLARDVAAGLARAHHSNIVHRDLKPDNVMVTPDGQAKILDFGLARATAEAAANGGEPGTTGVAGTPAYMAPEQARGSRVDARADVFSFGVVLYEMLAGKRPFAHRMQAAPEEALSAASDEWWRVEPLEAAAPGTQRELIRVVERCLKLDRHARFANGEELLAALPPLGLASHGGRWKRIARLGVVGVLAAVGVAGTVAAKRRSGAPSNSAAGSALAAPLTSPAATTYTDLPAPDTTVREAAMALASGMQALRDDNPALAHTHFATAVAHDPGMAVAYLRLAMTEIDPSDTAFPREDYQRAVALRARLSTRDQDLMAALAPVLGRAQPDRQEAIQLLEAAHARYPLDVEIIDWLASYVAGDPERGVTLGRQATALDPNDATAWDNLGQAFAALGQGADTRQAMEHCAALSPTSGDCLFGLAQLDEAEGRCEDFEHDARRAADSSSKRHWIVLAALVSNGRPEAALRDEIAEMVAARPAHARPIEQLREDALLAIYDGKFDVARALLDREAAALASTPELRFSYIHNYVLAVYRVGVALELGEERAAREVARDSAARYPMWHAPHVDRILWIERLATGNPDAIDARRAHWIDDRLRQGAPPAEVWAWGWAAPALTPAEAHAAIDALSDTRLHAPNGLEGMWVSGLPDAEAGRVYLLADRAADAVVYLKRAVASCRTFNAPFQYVAAALDLGRAYESLGRREEACDAYGKVIARWGKATPRSASAATARAAWARLNCSQD